jgi:hypothetical protein
VSAYTFYAYLA